MNILLIGKRMVGYFINAVNPQPKKREKRKKKSNFCDVIHLVSVDVSKSTAANYRTAVRSFIQFCHYKEIPLSSISSLKIHQYDAWLRDKGVCANTRSCYLRSLRSLYNKAVLKRMVRNVHPFRNLKLGNEKTIKRALKGEEIARLQNIKIENNELLSFYRDLFLFSFYAQGMPPIDLAHLKHKDIQHKMICYNRHKTGAKVCVRLENCMQEIINRYQKKDNEYVFPILNHYQYASFLACYNRGLKYLGKMINVDLPLSSYIARHSWASIAYANNISLSVISTALGHTNPNTTLTYISEIDNELLAKANKKVLKVVSKPPLPKR